jgi:hypothetical protein
MAGVWQRLWEEDPIGDSLGADRETLVLWTQAPLSGLYVDLRLPKSSPGRSLEMAHSAGFEPRPSALEARGCSFESGSFDEQQQILLASVLFSQKSFAGMLEYTVGDTTNGDALSKDTFLAQIAANAGDGALPLCTCFWKREIDYQPPSVALDIGVCASEPPNADGSIDLRETGADASYAEGWHRLPGTEDGPFLALQLESENDIQGSRDGYWVRTGNRFAYAIGRPSDLQFAEHLQCPSSSAAVKDLVGKNLVQALETLEDDHGERLGIASTYVCVVGEIDGEGSWRILHSTHPALVGCLLVGQKESALCCSHLQIVGEGLKAGSSLDQIIVGEGSILRRWKVMELEGSNDLPGMLRCNTNTYV